MWLAGVSRLWRVRYRFEPGNQGVGAIGRDRQKLREQKLVKKLLENTIAEHRVSLFTTKLVRRSGEDWFLLQLL